MSRDDDLLERATRALRATPPPDDGELQSAKLRMLAAHKAATKKGGARTLRWVLPLAAVLAAGTALAATPHGYERLANAINRVVGYEILAVESKPAELRQSAKPVSKPSAPVAQALPSEPAVEPAPVVAEPVVAEPAVAEPPSRQAAVELPRTKAPKKRDVAIAPPEPAPVPAAEPPAPVEEPAPQLVANADLAKYRAAHKAHFQDRDFGIALHYWEGYLRQYPNGTFAIEARYNRAICLLRLGRNDEARRALAPFANGEVGSGYRKAEATKLLQALE